MTRIIARVLAWAILSLAATIACAQEESASLRAYRRGLELLTENRLEDARQALAESARLEPRRAEVQNALGSVYDRLGQTKEAVSCYLRAIELEPKVAASYNNLGIAYLRSNRMERALEAFRKALRVEPENITSHYNLGLVLIRLRRFSEAVMHLERSFRRDTNDPGVIYNLGTAYLEQGKIQECLRLLEGIPGNGSALGVPEIQILYGIVLARANRLDEAVPHFETAIRLRPEAPEPYYRLGLIRQKKEQWSEARGLFEQAMKRDPSPPPEYDIALGQILAKLGLTEEAERALRRSLEKEDLPLAHMALGANYLDARQYGRAIAEFEHILKGNSEAGEAALNLALALHKSGKSSVALERLGVLGQRRGFVATSMYYQVLSNVLAALGRWAPSLDALKKATALAPGDLSFYFQMGLLLINAGAPQEALELLSRVDLKFPNSATTKVGLAQAQIAADRLDLAVESLQMAIRLSPDYDEPYFLLGNCHQSANRFDDAGMAYRQAIERSPERADFRVSLGLSLLRKGDPDAALAAFQKASALEPSVDALYQMASIFFDKKDSHETERALRGAIALNPNHSESRYLLYRLYLRLDDKIRAAKELELFQALKRAEQQTRKNAGEQRLEPVDYYLAHFK